jgi:hypothetical protein
VFVFVLLTFIKYPGIKDDVVLLIGLPECFVLALLEIKELILHVNALLVLYDDNFVIRVMSFVLESAKLFYINLFVRISFIVHLQTMEAQLLCILKRYEFLCQAILIVADEVRYFIMDFHTIVVFIITIFLLFPANITKYVLHIYMSFELVLVKEILVAKFTKGMHESYITKLINVSLLEMFIQCFISVKFLLLQNTGLLFHANFTKLLIIYQT